MNKIEILWDALGGSDNGYEANLKTSVGVLDLHNFTSISGISSDLNNIVSIFFLHDKEKDSDPDMKKINVIEFRFLKIEDFFVSPLQTSNEFSKEMQLLDLAFYKRPNKYGEIHCQFIFANGKKFDIKAEYLELYIR